MNTQEETRILAEKVMGWEYRGVSPGLMEKAKGYYVTSAGKYVCNDIEWTPHANISQAITVAETMRSKGYHIKLDAGSSTHREWDFGWLCELRKNEISVFGEGDIASAICAAAIKVGKEVNYA